MTTQPGRIESLTAEEEIRLKELWAHLLTFWGKPSRVPVSNEGKLLLKSSSTLSVETETVEETKKGKFSKFKSLGKKKDKKSDGKSKNSGSTIERSTSLSESIQNIPSNKEIEKRYSNDMVHSALKDSKPDEIYDIFWRFLKFDSPDNLILRFLRARKWDTDKSLAMLSNTLHWRLRESKIDEIMRGGELKLYEDMQASEGKTLNAGIFKNFELFKTYIRNHDKNNRPLVIVRPRLHHSSDQTVEEMEIYTLMVIENARIFLKEPVDSCSILFDMSNFSLSNMDYSPVKFMISVFEAHYPESLGVLLIHKAPWVFSGIWNIIKNWLDPVVASKIHFTKTTKDLEEFIDLPLLSEDLGGKDSFKPEYIWPKAGENDLVIKDDIPEKIELLKQRKELVEKFVAVTVKWVEAADSELSSQYLAEKIKLGKKLSANYGKLDKYLRGRSIFDRLGLVDAERL